jgi:Phycobilisome protein/Family of unknown function (DUF6519)
MGNFSRNTFDAIKQYVSVRLQQGVPLVDADWNEREDIRRSELQTFLKWFIGDGIPADNDGFNIVAEVVGNNQNDFIISAGEGGAGRCLINGLDVSIAQDINFKSQRLHVSQTNAAENGILMGNVPTISMPTALDPANPYSVTVYLDVWEWEVGEAQESKLFPLNDFPRLERLINPVIGIETCVRTRREWCVRVRIGNTLPKLNDLDYIANHSYYALAQIDNRQVSNSTITVGDIIDLRQTGLTLAKYLKVPIRVVRGSTLVDNDAIVRLFSQLHKALRNRLEKKSLFVDAAPTDLDKTLVYFALQDISEVCTVGIVQAKTNNLNPFDALQVIITLAEAQETFLNTLEIHGNPIDDDKTKFINEYRRRLNSLRDQLVNELFDAYTIQQSINGLLSASYETAQYLSREWDKFLNIAFQKLIQEQPELVSPGGLFYGQQRLAEFLRNFSSFLQSPIIQSCEQESIGQLDLNLFQVKETLNALGVPLNIYIKILQFMKENIAANLNNDAKILAVSTFDRTISDLSS